MTKRRVHAEARRYWSDQDNALLRELYPDTPTIDVARRLRRSLSTTYQHARSLGLRKSDAYLASPAACRTNGRQGMGTRFQKGHEPHNKGKAYPRRGRMAEGHFKKGQAGWNWKPIGATRMIEGYQYTKIADTRLVPWTRNWKQTHVVLWETANGPLPRGHALVFKNRDRMDIRLDNLELLTRRELMLRNTVHNLPKPVAQAVQLLGALNRKINRRTRNEEQNRRPA